VTPPPHTDATRRTIATELTRLGDAQGPPAPDVRPTRVLDDSACKICERENCEGEFDPWCIPVPGHPLSKMRPSALAPAAPAPSAPAADAAPAEDFYAFRARLQRQPVLGWHLPGLIPDEGICLWHGQPRDFKSLCALEALLALATKRPAFGASRFTPPQALAVAYFTEEDSERLFDGRLHWLTAKSGTPLPRHFYLFVRKGLSFDQASGRAFILQALQQTGAVVAAFDPVRSYTALSDKGPADLAPVTQFVRHLQNETRAKTLLLVSHDTKPPATGVSGRSRSQQASGGGIFSISDCPVAFTKLAWNKVAVYPEDYKLSGDPTPFEVTFTTDEQVGDDGPRFGSWVVPVATTKSEHAIEAGAAAKKILAFLEQHAGWHTTDEVKTGAKLQSGVGHVLASLRADGRVLSCTGAAAVALGRSVKAKLWRWPMP
jgi:hypothetical protein